jgi:hypothetical protein
METPPLRTKENRKNSRIFSFSVKQQREPATGIIPNAGIFPVAGRTEKRNPDRKRKKMQSGRDSGGVLPFLCVYFALAGRRSAPGADAEQVKR